MRLGSRVALALVLSCGSAGRMERFVMRGTGGAGWRQALGAKTRQPQAAQQNKFSQEPRPHGCSLACQDLQRVWSQLARRGRRCLKMVARAGYRHRTKLGQQAKAA